MSIEIQEVITDQGAAAPVASSWPVEVTDGTNVLGTAAHPIRIDPTGTTIQPISGTVTTNAPASSTSTVTGVVLVANTNTTLLSANVNRKKAIIYVPKGTTYIKFGVTASATSFTYAINTNQATIEVPIWQGQIDIISNSAQTVLVTELT